MSVLGVSVYPDIRPLDEIADYLHLAAKHGFTRVFTSMFSVEGTPEELLAYFRDLDAVAHECGMEISLDINPECMERLGATPSDLSVFEGIKADILRMDGAYGGTSFNSKKMEKMVLQYIFKKTKKNPKSL